MEYLTLEDYLKLPKKSKLSNDKKVNFQKRMIELMKTEGCSHNCMKYFWGGVALGSSIAICDYMDGMDEADRIYTFSTIVSSGETATKDNGTLFRAFVSILAQGLYKFQTDKKLLCEIINAADKYSCNKNGTRLEAVEKIIENNFLPFINVNIKISPLNEIVDEPNKYSGFASMLKQVLADIENRNNDYSDRIQYVQLWLTGFENCEDKNSSAQSKSLTAIERAQKDFDCVIKLLKQMASDIEKNKKENEQYKNTIEDLQDKIKKLNDMCDNKSLKILQANEDLKKKEIELTELRNEVTKRNEVIAIYEADKNKTLEEKLKLLASKLKAEYYDFYGAMDNEMTIDLGENMRHQLESVFKILEKNGVKIGRS